ncbi:hypothetical protein MMB17_07240 [Methylobacterium organophilum]|uniref:hypothetical protein n=1 Tax=Methylobacterium organophilum TaxID=410 RepID=UPI001F1422A6|nr:hypothetical protein [Methylobacterium organophilum]UMY19084.1 hypothetical protein MMB17_07240 [Methylobacterium organophilum]
MAENSTITRDTVMAGGLRDAGHLNYGRRGGGTIWQHTTIPRLSAIDRPTLDDEETKRLGVSRLREWSVDGGRAGSLDDAIAALNVPPVFTPEEAEVLAFVPMEWTKLVPFRDALGAGLGREVTTTLLMLRHKGDDLIALRERVAAAKEGSRDLDVAIMLGLGLLRRENRLAGCPGEEPLWRYWNDATNASGDEDVMVPKVSTSLDAAVALLGKVLPGAGWDILGSGAGLVWSPHRDAPFWECAATPPLALCLALLTAKIAETEAGDA